MLDGISGSDPLRVIQLEHLVQEVERLWVVHLLAQNVPWYLFLLHFVWNKATVAVLEGDFFDRIASKEACEWNQITYGEVFDLRTIIQTENWMATCTE